MDHLLPTLIEGATAARDKESARLQQLVQALRQSEATLARLREFRVECLARSAAGSLGRADAVSLQTYQGFMARLDQALLLQGHDLERKRQAVTLQQQRLAASQQKLLAFQTLVRRRAAVHALKESRRAQRECDEFAARALARATAP